MTRIMGDTTRNNIDSLPMGLQLIAGYDTGTPDIQWTQVEWDRFPKIPHIHIDQGFGDTRAKEAHALVFDVETGAFSPDQAKTLMDINTSPRPTIYVNRDNMLATIAAARQSPKWHGDIWLAFPGWHPGIMLPPIPPGCRYVAIQNVFAGTYDTSVVLDDSWPNPLDEPADWRDQALAQATALANAAIKLEALIRANTP